jgi:2-dehydropantoate 2-reductase
LKILIYGAGVIGRIYAATLCGNNDVTLLARGENYLSLEKNGIVLKNAITGKKRFRFVKLTQQLAPDDFFDLIIVSVRLDQVESILAALKENISSPLIMMMFNNPGGMDQLAEKLKPKQVLAGFPGYGGKTGEGLTEFIPIKEQPTTIGALDGKKSSSLKQVKKVFEESGIKTSFSNNIQAWLITHAVFVSCVAAALNGENQDAIDLSKKRPSVVIMVKSVREGLAAVKALGLPIAPSNIKAIFTLMPLWFSVWYWQHALRGKTGLLAIAPHAKVAKVEMQLLAKKILTIVKTSTVPAPCMNELLSEYIDSR